FPRCSSPVGLGAKRLTGGAVAIAAALIDAMLRETHETQQSASAAARRPRPRIRPIPRRALESAAAPPSTTAGGLDAPAVPNAACRRYPAARRVARLARGARGRHQPESAGA